MNVSKNDYNTILKILLGLIVMGVCVQHIFNIYQPTLLDDEYCYWSIAAYLNNKDWSSVTSWCSYYSYGYSFILFIIMKFTRDTVLMYRAAVVINGLLLVGSYLILDRILNRIYGGEAAGRNKITLVSFLAIMIPCNINYASVNLTECLLVFLFLVLVWFIVNADKNDTYVRALGAAAVSGYAYMVHQRMLCVVAALMLTLIVMTIMKKYSLSRLITYIAGVVAMLGVHSYLKGHFKQAVWLGRNSGAGNDYGSVLGNVKYIFSSFNNFARFIVGIIGKLYYYASATYIIGAIAVIVMVVVLWKYFRKVKNEAGVTICFCLFVCSSFIMLLGLSSVFMAKMESGGLSPLVYGRYMEVVYPAIVAVGIMWLSTSGDWSIKKKLYIIISGVACYGLMGLVVRMYIKRRSLQVLNYISCGQIYKYMSGDNLPVFKMMLTVAVTFAALMLVAGIKQKRKVFGYVLAIAVFAAELRTAYIPFSNINLWLQDSKNASKSILSVLEQQKGDIYYCVCSDEEKQSRQNREYLQYWLQDRTIKCVEENELEEDNVKMGKEDVIVVSDADKIRDMDNRGEYEKIYEEEGFVSVYRYGG